MNNNYKIGKVEAIFAISIVMVNRIIFNLPYSILENTGTGSVLYLIYIGIIGLALVLIINKLFKTWALEYCDLYKDCEKVILIPL